MTTEYRVFANAPNDNDLPDVELDEPALKDIEDHYFRYLGVRGATEFYMARTDHEDTVTQGLCFIAVDTETDEATSKCHGPDDLDPMVIHLETPVEAFLIPDDTHIEKLPEGWSQPRRNVVVVTEPDRRQTNQKYCYLAQTCQLNTRCNDTSHPAGVASIGGMWHFIRRPRFYTSLLGQVVRSVSRSRRCICVATL